MTDQIDPPMQKKYRSFTRCHLIQDIMLFCVLFAILGLYRFAVKTKKRGFYCDDNSIRHPIMHEMISSMLLLMISVTVTLIVIISMELYQWKFGSDSGLDLARKPSDASTLPLQIQDPEPKPNGFKEFASRSLLIAIIFLLGYVIQLHLVYIGKLTLGELRPRFLAVCRPNWNQTRCVDHEYVINYECQGSESDVNDARQSFPSGHSSTSAYVAFFISIYIRYKASGFPQSQYIGRTIMPVCQFVSISAAFFIGISRVADYSHHMHDVIAGWILGFVTAVSISYRFGILITKQ